MKTIKIALALLLLAATAAAQTPTPKERSLPRASLPQGFVPRDSFDAEIFNRRHFPGRK